MKLLIILISFAIMALAEVDENAQLMQLLNEGNKHFTAQMFNEVVKDEQNKNIVMSAFSVIQPLALLSLAAKGNTHDQILATIGLPNDTVTKRVFPLVNNVLRTIKGVELKMANKIYIKNGYELNEDFNTVSRNVFESEVKDVDFTKSVETADEINEWVEGHTNHRIKDLVSSDSLTKETRAILVNALYFKGNWKEQFNSNYTVDRDFYITKTKTIKVPTMFKNGNFRYGESVELNAKLLELPYDGDEASFLIVLPNEIDGIVALEDKLKNPEILTNAVSNLIFSDVEVYIPKFKIETTTDLGEVLQKMGITDLFDENKAQLSKLLKTNEQLCLSKATQKAFIEVNEEGAEAAAANIFEVVAVTSAIINIQKLYFKADRPFYFELRHKDNVLFNGVVTSFGNDQE